MGVVEAITADSFPKQGPTLGRRVAVAFHYDTRRLGFGTIVRVDAEDPFRMIIKLDNDLYVLSTECQYKFVKEEI